LLSLHLLELLRLLRLHGLCCSTLLNLLLLPLGLLELLGLLSLHGLGGGALLHLLLLSLGLLELLRLLSLNGLCGGALLNLLLLPLHLLELLRLLSLHGLSGGALLHFLLLPLHLLRLQRLLKLLLLPRRQRAGRRGGGAAERRRRRTAAQRDRCAHPDGNAHQAVCRHTHDVSSPDRSTAEIVGRHDRDRARRQPVGKLGIARSDPSVERGAIGFVDITLARTVARAPGLARGQGKPAHTVAATANREVRVDAGSRSTHEGHEGG
jgi:hypothetical protein